MVRNKHILYFRLLDPRMVEGRIMFTKYVSEWATNLGAISLVSQLLGHPVVLCYFFNSIFLSAILFLLIVFSTGHVRTFCKFLRDSSDRCLEKALAVLARIFETEKISGTF